MKTKLFTALKQEFASLGLGDEVLQGQADALAATGLVTDENLTTIVQGQKPFLSSLQKGIDKRVSDAVAKVKVVKPAEAAAGGEQGKTDEPIPDEAPAWAKAMAETNKALLEKVIALEGGKAADSRKQQLADTLKDADPAFKDTTIKAFGRMSFSSDDEFTGYLNEVKEDATKFATSLNERVLGAGGKPITGSQVGAKEASKEAVESIVKQMKV